ncbi:MAG: hypothetical protein H7Y31_05495 [Chitinophagaceae bacterium]|nr:hypothetical protein [Chitinophagaceae bacterium]
MQRTLFIIMFCFSAMIGTSQGVGIGTLVPQATLDIRSAATNIFPSISIKDSSNKGLGIVHFSNIDFPGKFIEFSGYKGQPSSAETYLHIKSDSALIATFAGNGFVGINNGEPKERLDVNGNMNLSGTITANGVDGLPNQVLMKDINGTLAWGNPNGPSTDQNNNVAIFFATTSGAVQNWPVPAGVTRITIELWGAGGSGGTHSGGGGGGYARGNFDVDPGKSIDMTIGLGGVVGGAQVNGQQTSATINSNTIIAFGGLKASESFEDGYPIPAGGFYTVTGSLFRNYTGVPGESGTATTEMPAQYSATEFRLIKKIGNGGDAGNSNNTGGRGGQTISLLPGGLFDATRYAPAQIPGGGGAAQSNAPGAAGLIVIHY